jgi:glycosyltransferase involved in cell wall biosynthesis
MQPVVVIPAYEPSPALPPLVRELLARGVERVVVVDDGSSPACAPLFDELRALPGVAVLRHARNMGKGRALKTAFNHLLVELPDCPGAVTADADGQHLAEDIVRVLHEARRRPQSLILGARGFREADVPLRSRLGNRATLGVFRFFTGLGLKDTQTGLRAIPAAFLPRLLGVASEGYDFELEMLILAARSGLPIEEVPIATVYLDGNATSHFNPLLDSFKVYFVFLRFSALSLATAAIDYTIFAFFALLTGQTFLSICLARLGAGAFNFTLAKGWVFKSRGAVRQEALRYAGLVAVLMAFSYTMTVALNSGLGLPLLLAKAVSELLLFVLSFAFQRQCVFAGPRQEAPARPTDWDAYYRRRPGVAGLTRRYTIARLLGAIGRHAPAPRKAVELGGANSCFFPDFRKAHPQAAYHIVDSNRTGLDLFARSNPGAPAVTLEERDVLAPAPGGDADLCLSIGLIEHFGPEGTAAAIRAHFDAVRPGGVVVISFPTPTWLYRAARGAVELAGRWRFTDERPLGFAEVLEQVARHGQVLETFVNWPIVLTQGVVVARKHPA